MISDQLVFTNVAYKVISWMLVNRLQYLMDAVIYPFQSALLKCRAIGDNIAIASETLKYVKRCKDGGDKWVFMRLDIHKAYDTLSWSFLSAMLQLMGFPSHWQLMIHQCVSIISYRLLLNVFPFFVISPSRGLYLGGPMSPYVFLLCSNILSCLLINAESRR